MKYWRQIVYYCTVYEQETDEFKCCTRWREKKVETELTLERFEKVEEDIKYIVIMLEDLLNNLP